jgi:hypothetical protein
LEFNFNLARAQGASDTEIHDTVLIAAAFCMFNRYVDGLDTWQPRDEALYRERGKLTVIFVNLPGSALQARRSSGA